MKYKVIRDTKYDFSGQSYSSIYPNLHKYPATMLPQIGIEILKDLNISKGKLLDPYCGSGSSFISGLECGIKDMKGFDINPLAVLISKVKFTKIPINDIIETKANLRDKIFDFIKIEKNLENMLLPKITNIDYWFSKDVILNLNILRHFILQIPDKKLQNFFLIPFSETVRDCSYTRNSEFKLYRIKNEDILLFNPNVLGIYFKKLQDTIFIYQYIYFPRLTNEITVNVYNTNFKYDKDEFDIVLTSPPYGDSKTTVSYGQFSTLPNEWIGFDYSREIDKMLMGGIKTKKLYQYGLISDYIEEINKKDKKRAYEISSFYNDLEYSISDIAKSVKKGGKAIYIVGNRTVKGIQLPTDQFIAEKFEENNFKHLITFKRALSNKSMPLKNSPTNKRGTTTNTMLYEYIVVNEKK